MAHKKPDKNRMQTAEIKRSGIIATSIEVMIVTANVKMRPISTNEKTTNAIINNGDRIILRKFNTKFMTSYFLVLLLISRN